MVIMCNNNNNNNYYYEYAINAVRLPNVMKSQAALNSYWYKHHNFDIILAINYITQT